MFRFNQIFIASASKSFAKFGHEIHECRRKIVECNISLLETWTGVHERSTKVVDE